MRVISINNGISYQQNKNNTAFKGVVIVDCFKHARALGASSLWRDLPNSVIVRKLTKSPHCKAVFFENNPKDRVLEDAFVKELRDSNIQHNYSYMPIGDPLPAPSYIIEADQLGDMVTWLL